MTTAKSSPRFGHLRNPARPVRVLHLIHMTGPGGAETVVLQLATGTQDDACRALVALPDHNWLGTELKHQGVTPIIVPDTRRVAFLQGIVRTLRTERIDILHTHLLGPASYGSVAALATGIPMVCTFHGHSDVTSPSLRESIRFALIRRAASRIVLVSDALRDLLLATGRMTPQQTLVIPNGVDTARFRPRDETTFRSELNIPADTFVVGTVGNVRRAKDYPTFLRAAALLVRQHPQYRFVIAGEADGPLYQELLHLRAELGLDDHVIFAGFRKDVERVLNGLDVLVVSSSSEGFSLATIQAMASGVPVVATRCGGPDGILTDGTNGLLVNVRSPGEIAAALERLRTDSLLREHISRRALDEVAASYSLDGTIQAYKDLYASVLDLSGV